MFKLNFKIILFAMIFVSCVSSALLKADPEQNQAKEAPKVEIPLENITPQEDETLKEYIKEVNDPRIVYKDGRVIFYPNPNVKERENKIFSMTIVVLICTMTIILIPVALILMFIEIYHLSNLSETKKLAESLDPYIILDDDGIKIGNKKISWSRVKSITKEEKTTYKDGYVESRREIFYFYNKYLDCLFHISDSNEYIENNIDTLIYLIYHFLEKSKTEFTQNVQKTSVSKNTQHYPVYTPVYTRR